jgi:hypothetical protein
VLRSPGLPAGTAAADGSALGSTSTFACLADGWRPGWVALTGTKNMRP